MHTDVVGWILLHAAARLPWLLLLALAAAAQQDPADKRDVVAPKPVAVRLEYRLHADDLAALTSTMPGVSAAGVLASLLQCLRARLPDAVFAAGAGDTFTVELPPSTARQVEGIRQRIELRGSLEQRLVATATGRGAFDLAAEAAQLRKWLDAGGRDRVRQEPHAIEGFHRDPGPIAGGALRWVPHVIAARGPDRKQWSRTLTLVPAMADAVVPLWTDAEWNGGEVPAGHDRPLVELVAIDHRETGFAADDFERSAFVAVKEAEQFALQYALCASKAAMYADWTERHISRHAAWLVNGELYLAPCFLTRLPGVGRLAGMSTEAEVEDLAAALRGGQLPVRVEFAGMRLLPAK